MTARRTRPAPGPPRRSAGTCVGADVIASCVAVCALAFVAGTGPSPVSLVALLVAAVAGDAAAFLRIREAWLDERGHGRRAFLGILSGALLLAPVAAASRILALTVPALF